MRMLPVAAVVPLLLLGSSAVAPRPTGACSLATNEPHYLDAAFASDTTPPSGASVALTGVDHHEDDGNGGGCGTHVASCGSYGRITLAASATDDLAPPDQIGFQMLVVGGDPPRGLDPSPEVARAVGEELILYFDHDDHDFAFELEVRAVDLNGNLGPPTVLSIAP